ncbi:MAG: hypothetical protein R2774_06435 [Saprospiraceae bacterium]
MTILPSSKIKDIIDQFSKQFDHLRIEFYEKHHKENEGSSIKTQLDHNISVASLNPDLGEVKITLDEEMSVSEFEAMMHQKYKLNIQVFRNSAGTWLQTTSTDHWSLSKQNGKGRRSNLHYDIEPPKLQDFDLV